MVLRHLISIWIEACADGSSGDTPTPGPLLLYPQGAPDGCNFTPPSPIMRWRHHFALSPENGMRAMLGGSVFWLQSEIMSGFADSRSNHRLSVLFAGQSQMTYFFDFLCSLCFLLFLCLFSLKFLNMSLILKLPPAAVGLTLFLFLAFLYSVFIS